LKKNIINITTTLHLQFNIITENLKVFTMPMSKFGEYQINLTAVIYEKKQIAVPKQINKVTIFIADCAYGIYLKLDTEKLIEYLNKLINANNHIKSIELAGYKRYLNMVHETLIEKNFIIKRDYKFKSEHDNFVHERYYEISKDRDVV